MGLRIVIDEDLCQGHGVCEAEAPDHFELGKDHKVVVLKTDVDELDRAAVELAVKYCPTHAISIVED